jgi:acetyltransferase-like isoleucine patch superfamily enzyme
MIMVGAGGASIDALSFLSHEEVYFYDDNKTGLFQGYKILGTTDDLCRMQTDDTIYLAIGSVGDNRVRNRIYKKLTEAGLKIDPLLLCQFISRNAKIGNNVLANVGSQIHHDCIIGDNCVISPGVILCGNVTLEQNVFVGAGAVIIQGITVGENAVMGMGSVVLKDVPPNAVMVGNPARFTKWNT